MSGRGLAAPAAGDPHGRRQFGDVEVGRLSSGKDYYHDRPASPVGALEPVELEPASFDSAHGSFGLRSRLWEPRSWRTLSWWERISRLPHPTFNMISIALAVVAMIFLIATLSLASTASSYSWGRDHVPAEPCQSDQFTKRAITAANGAVASDDATCSIIGKDMLAEGGNAVDAAIATALCLGVVHPMSSGIGGGAFMLIRLANGTTEVIDSRETAPAAASEDMFVANPEKAVAGGLAVAVPGEVAGLHLAWQRYGQLPWARLFEPSIKLAEGFKIGLPLAAAIEAEQEAIMNDPGLRGMLAPDGELLEAGDTCLRAELAKTLRVLADEGPQAMYSQDGVIGKQLVEDIQQAGGIITSEDIIGYHPVIREPLVTDAFGYTVIGAPPPSSGGAAMSLILHMMEGFMEPFAGLGPLATHRLVEAFKHAFALRMSLGDPAYVDTANVITQMLNASFAEVLRADIDNDITFEPAHYGSTFAQLDDHGTTHLSVVDSMRNAVAMTSTINTYFGAKVLSTQTGIVLNDEMDDFSIPGKPNAYGMAPSPANYVAGAKRPLSSMSPTIVLQGDHVKLVVGASGGPRIITSTVAVTLAVIAQGLEPYRAVSNARVHHQLYPNQVLYEEFDAYGDNTLPVKLPEEVIAALTRRNHTLHSQDGGLAVCQLVVQDLEDSVGDIGVTVDGVLTKVRRGRLTAVSDVRKDGYPAGY
eukprot:jgi/Chlat1/3353/Chrsp23S03664